MTGRPRTRANGEGSIFPYRNGGFAAYAWVTTPAGERKRKYVYGPTREAVYAKWLKLQQEASRGPVAATVPTVATYLSDWLRDVVEPNLAPMTAATYESLVRLYLIPGLGARRLDRLSVRDFQKWMNAVRKTCQCCAQGKDARRQARRQRCCAVGKCCRQLASDRTVRDSRAVLRSALSNAIADELISRNVAAIVKLPRGRRSRKPQSWSSEEARRFLESARTDDDPLYSAYVLVLVLGLRKGEVLGLAWEDVDLDAAELTVEFQLQRVRRQLIRRQTKTEASDDTLPLPGICVAALRLRDVEQKKTRLAAGPAWQDSAGLIFTGRYGTPIDPRTINRAFTARAGKAGVRRITVHDARRTCASLLADLDVHPRVAMQILRHADFKLTMEVYTPRSRPSKRGTR
jgi:integrase